MVYQTKKEKESHMKAATYVSAGNLQMIDQPKPVIKTQQMQLCGSWKQPSVAQTFTS